MVSPFLVLVRFDDRCSPSLHQPSTVIKMASIHMFFPMTSGNLDDDNPIPTLKDFGRVVNHTPRPFTLGCISSALLDLLPCACVSAPHTDTQYGLGDGSPIIHDPTSILPLPPRRSTPPSYMSPAMPIPTTIDY